MKAIVKIVAFRGNSGNSGGDGGGALNSNHRGTGRGKTAGDLGERVPRGPLGIPRYMYEVLKEYRNIVLRIHVFIHF